MRMKKRFTKKLLGKIILLALLVVIFIIDLVYVSFYRGKSKEDVSESNNHMEAENQAEKSFIVNLEEFVSVSIKDNDVLLDEEVKEYCKSVKTNIESAEVFFVTIPEDDENKIIFFLKLQPTNEILEASYDYETEMIMVCDSKYTEEEIVNEVWLGDVPAIRDEQ